MLIIAEKLRLISFSSLMEVYIEGNLEKAKEDFSYEPEVLGLRHAEEDFYHYLSACFFKTPGAKYAIWEEHSRYVSALRLEPYKDGLLISALETAPDHRRKGYATLLLKEVLSTLNGKVYSHVSKTNIASLKTHEKCGFHRIEEHAVYLDGSVNSRACTLRICL